MKKEEELMAYLAGAIDGDGSLSLCKLMHRSNILHYPVIQLGNLKEDLVDLFCTAFDAKKSVRVPKAREDGSNRRTFYTGRITHSVKCLPVLMRIRDFLVGKREQAEFLINFINENPSMSGGRRLDHDILANRERAYLKMHEMNLAKKQVSLTKKVCLNDNDSPLFWSYMAGLMDTDGHFSISHRKDRYFRAQIQLHMTNFKCVNYIQENFVGGHLGVKKDKSCSLGFVYRWDIGKKEHVRSFLLQIIPYLRQKKQQAELLLKFLDESQNYLNCKKPYLPESEIDFRRNCRDEISRLNKL